MKFAFNFFVFLKENKFNLLDIIFPPSCIICGKLNKNYICTKCEKRFEKFKKFNIIDNQKYIKDKFNIKYENFKQNYYIVGDEKYYWEKLLYCFDYKSIVRKYLLKYKFNDEAYFSNFFANQILNNKKTYEILKTYDIIIPVPMEKGKKLKRGYNQTELITKIIEKNVEITEIKVVEKIKKTNTQSLLSQEMRKLNVENAFCIKNENLVKNKNVIIFDDIYTTGATVNEISKLLKKAKVNKILVLVIAKD